jgi:deazaflavin-dependent oxidoreductase (nitroreductase family)
MPVRRTARRLGVAGVAIGATGFARALGRGDVPGFFTHRFNPLVVRFGLAGGRRSPWAILEHVGRRSGAVHRTPIFLFSHAGDDHAWIWLTYGTDTHLVRNIRAAGGCRVRLHGEIIELAEPAIVPARDVPAFPRPVRMLLDRAGRNFLRLRVLEQDGSVA